MYFGPGTSSAASDVATFASDSPVGVSFTGSAAASFAARLAWLPRPTSTSVSSGHAPPAKPFLLV
ncbi:MAG: hypothetical protein IPJ34_36240 [Myxococcales bacterium]|nr:hypothetical protein [Myxococcales bacterium]